MVKKLKAIFCGTPDFSLPSLEMLFNHPLIDLIAVITMPDRPAGRGQKLLAPSVADFAIKNKIKLFQTENVNKDEDLLQFMQSENVDFVLVLAFAQFLGKRFLDTPTKGCFNIHTSVLPKYRGAAPIQYALLNGDKETGVSIQKMVKQMDAGDLVHSKLIPIARHENGGQLYTRLKFQAALSTNVFVEELLCDQVEYFEQDHQAATFAPTLKKQDGHLDFKSQTYEQIHNRIRALAPWPGTFCFMGKKRLKVFSIEESTQKLSPGKVSTDMNSLVIGCADKSLRLTKVQLEGKKACSDLELLNGLKNSKTELVINP